MSGLPLARPREKKASIAGQGQGSSGWHAALKETGFRHGVQRTATKAKGEKSCVLS